jgi:branched-subunit amino acid aminotransferase/4-amino-4-deoxychorismate lyase
MESCIAPDRVVLQGITRKSVIDVARASGIEVRLETIPVELAYNCNEIFMSTTAGGIMPITSLDGRPVNGGQIGPVTKVGMAIGLYTTTRCMASKSIMMVHQREA